MERIRQQENCRCIVIGYEQDFDSLSPKLLINKLQAYKFSDKATQLIRSYFQGRKNRVRIGSVTGDWVVVKRRCPQGSTFGPLMWNIFQNDQVYIAKEITKSVEKILVDNGERMTKWYQDNLLKVNRPFYRCLFSDQAYEWLRGCQ